MKALRFMPASATAASSTAFSSSERQTLTYVVCFGCFGMTATYQTSSTGRRPRSENARASVNSATPINNPNVAPNSAPATHGDTPVAGNPWQDVITPPEPGYCGFGHGRSRGGTSPSGITTVLTGDTDEIVLEVLDGATTEVVEAGNTVVEVVDVVDWVEVVGLATVVAGAHAAFRGSAGSG